MTRTAMGSIATIDQFIAQVGNVKTASEKAADGGTPLSEPGSIGGETSHPVKKVDDRLEKAKEGERSAENSRDVKADQGAPSVEGKPEASTKSAASIFGVLSGFAKKAEGVSTPGSAADDHISTTTKVAPTGEDPANETNSAKAGKEDKKQGGVGGTSHPASTENDQLDGHKYANDSLEKLATDMRTVGNNLLAQIHNLYSNQGQGQYAPQQTKQAAATHPQTKQAGAVDPRLAYYAGNELAALVAGHSLNKQATDNMVRNALADVVKQASDDADNFIIYARSFIKRAEEGEEPADPSAGGEDPAAAAGGDPMAGGGGGGGGGGEEEAMMAALGGGAGGGDPSGGMGGMGGGGDPADEEAARLALVLEQLGVSPEELEQALQAEAGGGGGAGGGMGGGDPMAAMGGGGGGGMETQANAGGGKRNAGTQKIAAAEISNHIREIITRSRARR
jgi:hypothetical protein